MATQALAAAFDLAAVEIRVAEPPTRVAALGAPGGSRPNALHHTGRGWSAVVWPARALSADRVPVLDAALAALAAAGLTCVRSRQVEDGRRFARATREISHDLSNGRPLQELLDRIVAASGRLLQVDRASIFLLGDGEHFAGQAWWGEGGAPVRTAGPTEVELRVLSTRAPLAISDTSAWVGNPYFSRLGVRSSLAVPLLIEQRVVGILNLHAIHASRDFDEDAIELANAFADQAAVAILNGQLYDRMRLALDRLLALYQAVRTIGRSLDRQDILHTAISGARKLSGAIAAVVLDAADAPCCRRHDPSWRASLPDTTRRSIMEAGPSAPATEGLGEQAGAACSVVLGDGYRMELYADHPDRLRDAGPALLALAQHAAAALQNAALFGSLSAARAELDALLRQLVTARDEESQRIAFDVHDGVAQLLVAADQHLQAAGHASSTGDDAVLAAELEVGRRHVVSGLRESRAIVNRLRPPGLDELGLEAAMIAHAAEVQATTPMRVSVVVENGSSHLPRPLETVLYRVFQEGLNNARKHSQADLVTVAVGIDEAGVTMTVHDDGVGPPSDDHLRGGTGIRSMMDRARSVGGTLEITGGPSAGTRIRLAIPLVDVHAR